LFRDADVAHYANPYKEPDHLRAAFALYRAFPANETFNAQRTGPINLPVVFGVGERDYFPGHTADAATVEEGLRLCRNSTCTNLQ
jgi:hypothetical protein